ncbi:MAG: Stk1 family PASTA domain-containing Ser/Thr kinase, partial [Promicromonosporaceae bacterium]|nr:Stk1 family PASTA domain-containing Ser/Thr kinase [Promicromonosporaceae bacterium]
MAGSDPMIGRLVDGRYEIRSRVARGGMATVYLARDRRLDRHVALKVMHSHLADGTDGAAFVSRFRREARAAARLTHSGVVAVYDQGVDGETSYLTMEYVPGSNLRRELRKHGTLPVGRTLDLLDQMLAALAAAHAKGLVHRDIKPENALLTEAGGQVKVADFGLARAVTEVTSTTTGTILGTVAYLAPEVIATGSCDARTDVYAIGILAYEMLTGTLPKDGSTPIQIAFQHVHQDVPAPSMVVDWLPPEIDRLVLAFTARDPARRPAGGAQALVMLREARSAIAAEHPDLLERRADPPESFTEARDEADEIPTDPTETPLHDLVDTDGDTLAETGTLHSIPLGSPADLSAQATQAIAQHQTARLPAEDEATIPPPPPPPASRKKMLLRALAIVLPLLALAAAGLFGTRWWFADGPGAWTQMPEHILGEPFAEVRAELTTLDLAYQYTFAYDDNREAGLVLTVDPSAGEAVRRDAVVNLVVSRGVRMVSLPDRLVGLDLAEAEAALTEVGLGLGRTQSIHRDDVPAGQVIGVDPAEGAQVPHHTTVTLTVSAGPAPVTVTQQVGVARDYAQAALEALGLIVEFAPDQHSLTVPAGHVISQSIPSGTVAHRTDSITLTISAGP